MFGVDFHDESVKDRHREALILLGRAGRSFDPLFWVNQTRARIAAARPGVIPVITDCRYHNEAEAMKAEGFLLVRLRAAQATIEGRGGRLLADESETDLDQFAEWDAIIDVDGRTPDQVARSVLAAWRAAGG